MPSLVSFHHRDMVFPAREDQITEWVESIDRWIATANARVAVAEERRGRRSSSRSAARRRRRPASWRLTSIEPVSLPGSR